MPDKTFLGCPIREHPYLPSNMAAFEQMVDGPFGREPRYTFLKFDPENPKLPHEAEAANPCCEDQVPDYSVTDHTYRLAQIEYKVPRDLPSHDDLELTSAVEERFRREVRRRQEAIYRAAIYGEATPIDDKTVIVPSAEPITLERMIEAIKEIMEKQVAADAASFVKLLDSGTKVVTSDTLQGGEQLLTVSADKKEALDRAKATIAKRGPRFTSFRDIRP